MTARINFFHEGRSGFTYRKMGLISLSLAVFFLAALLLQTYRARLAQAEWAALEEEVHLLKMTQGLEGPSSAGAPNPLETVIISLMSEPLWSEVMRVVPRSLPEGIWVENIQGEAAEGGKMTLEGTAYQARLVPGFLDRLRSYNVFSKVNLISSEAVSKELDSPLKFKIQANPRNR